MARYTDSVCRMCRREGTKLFLKGDKCFSAKCAQTTRPTPPGQHGQARARKASEYGTQLREKQKARRAYGLMEGQFRRTFTKAEGMKGITGDNLLSLLERRLDNVVYRSGLASSRAQARQFVCHGLMTVNGKKVDIPSFTTKVGDVISVRANSRDIEHFKIVKEGVNRVIPKWLTTTAADLTTTVNALPQRDDVDLTLQENMIVEFYSR
ncbi:MAG TPA: 30S ribosomal protein S4 [Candidatus Limiplasma sp.]|nr:30S ribosomal protein S4 [Candidatus Limiplasma sp.]